MHFYGMSYEKIMKLPVRVLWFLNNNIIRLMAEKDIRSMRIATSTQDIETYTQTRHQLESEMGEVLKHAPQMNLDRDELGFQKLKSMCLSME